MNPGELLQWWNLVFILPFTAGLIYLFLMCSGLVSSEHGAGVGGDIDHDIQFEHDVDLDHDIQVDHGDIGHDQGAEHDTDSENDAEQDAGDGLFLRALSFLGLGKAPVSMLFMCFCFIWGFTGWAANMVFSKVLVFPALFVWPSLAAAFLASVFFTRWLAKLFSRFMPTTQTYGTTNQQLIGKSAEATFNITEKFGMARTTDDAGNQHDIYCRVQPGKEEIPKQSRVILMQYDVTENFFYVKLNPLN
jgi:hypothetical protein